MGGKEGRGGMDLLEDGFCRGWCDRDEGPLDLDIQVTFSWLRVFIRRPQMQKVLGFQLFLYAEASFISVCDTIGSGVKETKDQAQI